MPRTTKNTAQARKRTVQRNQSMLLGVVAVVLIAAAIVAAYISSQAARPVSVTAANNASAAIYGQIPQSMTDDGAPILGDAKTKVIVMEFGEFACPHCREYQPIIHQIIDQYVRPGKARLIFRPMVFLTQPYSETAAKAALCSIKQNRFWEMDDALYDLQGTQGYQAFVPDTIQGLAFTLKMDGGALLNCLNSDETKKTIDDSANVFTKLNGTGTPTIVYSTDGANYVPFVTDPQGGPGIPSFDQIKATLDPIVS